MAMPTITIQNNAAVAAVAGAVTVKAVAVVAGVAAGLAISPVQTVQILLLLLRSGRWRKRHSKTPSPARNLEQNAAHRPKSARKSSTGSAESAASAAAKNRSDF
jgi:hypothetical protein